MIDSKPQLISIGMITYNHELYVRQAIESILQQKTTFKIELVIGEDCSTDSTRSICEEYALSHPEVVKLLPSEKNLGVTPNFIRTLLACSGDFIALCEGDDYWTDPLKLQKQVEFLEANPGYVACFHPVMVVDAAGNPLRSAKNSFIHNRDLSSEELILGRVMSTLSLCYRNVITEFPEEFYKSPTGDNFLSSLLGQYGKAKYLDTIRPSAYRMHAGGAWSLQHESKKKMNLLLSYFWMWQYYSRIGKPEYARGFYRKILLEGFYSNPFSELAPGPLGRAEWATVKIIRRLFRLLRNLLP